MMKILYYFQCKSFDYDNRGKVCKLFTVSTDDPDVHLIASAGTDNYQSKSAHCNSNYHMSQ